MLALGFHGRSKVKDFIFGSNTEYILANTNLLLLINH
jgi:nucleotide-binding universal stress UspA family protein